jgi:hypothetical protein
MKILTTLLILLTRNKILELNIFSVNILIFFLVLIQKLKTRLGIFSDQKLV